MISCTELFYAQRAVFACLQGVFFSFPNEGSAYARRKFYKGIQTAFLVQFVIYADESGRMGNGARRFGELAQRRGNAYFPEAWRVCVNAQYNAEQFYVGI